MPSIWDSPVSGPSYNRIRASKPKPLGQRVRENRRVYPSANQLQEFQQQSGVEGGGGGQQQPASNISAPAGPSPQSVEAESLREAIRARRDRANSIFSALTDSVKSIAGERSTEVNEDYGRQVQGITEDQIATENALTSGYGARGLLDSSYRINATDQSVKQAEGGIAEVGRSRQGALAKIGEYLKSTLAKISGTKDSVNDLNLDEIGDDVDGLETLRDKLDSTIRDLRVQEASTGTDEGFRGSLQKAVPGVANIRGQVKTALDNLAASSLPTTVKSRIASQVVQSYDPSDASYWQKYFQDKTTEQEQVATQPSGG